jgi:hypothetical protein
MEGTALDAEGEKNARLTLGAGLVTDPPDLE